MEMDSTEVVLYDPEVSFVPSRAFEADYYATIIDSLVRLDTLPVALVNQLSVYQKLSTYKRSELLEVVDSIFESPVVPRSVVNAVNTYLAAIEDEERYGSGFHAYVPANPSPHPADAFYEHWNTLVPHPIRKGLKETGENLSLLLVDSAWNCGFAIPFDGVVTSHFGWRWGRSHNGTDIDLEVWDPVVAAFPGVVRVSRFYKGYGRVVVIRHYNGLETLYAHLHRLKVKPGDVVEAGDLIGLGGSSGNSTGSHLHFEMRFAGLPIDPNAIINFRKGRLKSELIQLQSDGNCLKLAPEGGKTEIQVYEVRKGDYLYKIARELGVSVESICHTNGIRSNETLRVGQKLWIAG